MSTVRRRRQGRPSGRTLGRHGSHPSSSAPAPDQVQGGPDRIPPVAVADQGNPAPAGSDGTGWGSSMRRWRAGTRPLRSALKRLASCTAKNRFYRANRDLGRVFKTEFLLSYLSEPPLRSRIRKGLLKVEQLHAWPGTCITDAGGGSTPENCTSK